MLLQVAVNPSLSKRIVVVTSRYTRDFEKLTASCKTGCSKELELMLGHSPPESFSAGYKPQVSTSCVSMFLSKTRLYILYCNDFEMFVGCLLSCRPRIKVFATHLLYIAAYPSYPLMFVYLLPLKLWMAQDVGWSWVSHVRGPLLKVHLFGFAVAGVLFYRIRG